jgi:hypothetical protein
VKTSLKVCIQYSILIAFFVFVQIHQSNNEVSCSCYFKGEFAFQIQAEDRDGDPLSYSISGPNAGFFTVDETTGTVTINTGLDREVGVLLF